MYEIYTTIYGSQYTHSGYKLYLRAQQREKQKYYCDWSIELAKKAIAIIFFNKNKQNKNNEKKVQK